MKRFTQILCILLIAVMILAVPAFAAEQASAFFMKHSCYLWKTSSTSFQVWFDVTATGGMDELGVSEIVVQSSSDGVNWGTEQTYYRSSYSNLTAFNTGYHSGYVTFSRAVSGLYYRARVTFYAENGNGIGEYIDNTSSIYWTVP